MDAHKPDIHSRLTNTETKIPMNVEIEERREGGNVCLLLLCVFKETHILGSMLSLLPSYLFQV